MKDIIVGLVILMELIAIGFGIAMLALLYKHIKKQIRQGDERR